MERSKKHFQMVIHHYLKSQRVPPKVYSRIKQLVGKDVSRWFSLSKKALSDRVSFLGCVALYQILRLASDEGWLHYSRKIPMEDRLWSDVIGIGLAGAAGVESLSKFTTVQLGIMLIGEYSVDDALVCSIRLNEKLMTNVLVVDRPGMLASFI